MKKMNVNINVNDTQLIECNDCACTEFREIHQIRRLSALMSPTGQETFIPIKMFQCSSCGHINKEFSE